MLASKDGLFVLQVAVVAEKMLFCMTLNFYVVSFF